MFKQIFQSLNNISNTRSNITIKEKLVFQYYHLDDIISFSDFLLNYDIHDNTIDFIDIEINFSDYSNNNQTVRDFLKKLYKFVKCVNVYPNVIHFIININKIQISIQFRITDRQIVLQEKENDTYTNNIKIIMPIFANMFNKLSFTNMWFSPIIRFYEFGEILCKKNRNNTIAITKTDNNDFYIFLSKIKITLSQLKILYFADNMCDVKISSIFFPNLTSLDITTTNNKHYDEIIKILDSHTNITKLEFKSSYDSGVHKLETYLVTNTCITSLKSGGLHTNAIENILKNNTTLTHLNARLRQSESIIDIQYIQPNFKIIQINGSVKKVQPIIESKCIFVKITRLMEKHSELLELIKKYSDNLPLCSLIWHIFDKSTEQYKYANGTIVQNTTLEMILCYQKYLIE